MKRSQIIYAIQQKLPSLEESQVHAAVKVMNEVIFESLENGGGLEVRGFGSLYIKHYAPQMMKNPKTEEMLQIGDRFLCKFKMSKLLHQRLNQQN